MSTSARILVTLRLCSSSASFVIVDVVLLSHWLVCYRIAAAVHSSVETHTDLPPSVSLVEVTSDQPFLELSSCAVAGFDEGPPPYCTTGSEDVDGCDSGTLLHGSKPVPPALRMLVGAVLQHQSHAPPSHQKGSISPSPLMM